MTKQWLIVAALAALVAVLSAALAAPAQAAMHATEEFESGETRPVSIAFLPPHVNLVKRRIIQREAQIDESAELAGHMAADLERRFGAQGYEVIVLGPEQINADPELRDLVLAADRRYAEMLAQVRSRLPRQIARRRYEAGDEMRMLAAKLGVDAIGFGHLQIEASAAGASAVAVLAGVGRSGSETMMSVSLIDGGTAHIEAYFVLPVLRRGSMFGYDSVMENPEGKVREMVGATVRDLPEAAPGARRRASDDDVLSDIESLLQD